MAVDAPNFTTAIDQTLSRVKGAIQQAAGATGASFQYLLATARMESNMDPSAAAATSSAKGLFQFIEQTWLGTVKEAGGQLGYGKYADAISKSDSGSYSVSDPVAKAEILRLRDDPVASSAMAGVLTQSNSFKLTGAIGRRPTDAELYMAHFMGVGGASKLINSAVSSPNTSAAALFPNAAAANRSIFYDNNGNERSVVQVYSVVSSRYDSAASSFATQTALATGGVAPISVPTTTVVDPVMANAAYLQGFPDMRSPQGISAPATPSAAPAPVSTLASAAPATAAPPQPIFRSLFQGGDRPQPVSPTVQTLWGKDASQTSSEQGATAASASKSLDLFSDRSGTFSN
jgi:hypothetical protein